MMNWKQTFVLLGSFLVGHLVGTIPSVFMLLNGVSMWIVIGYVTLVVILFVHVFSRLIDKLRSKHDT